MNWKQKEEKALQDAENKVLNRFNLTPDRRSKLELQKELYEKQSGTKAISRVSDMALKMGQITNTRIKTGKLTPVYDEKTNEIINFQEE